MTSDWRRNFKHIFEGVLYVYVYVCVKTNELLTTTFQEKIRLKTFFTFLQVQDNSNFRRWALRWHFYNPSYRKSAQTVILTPFLTNVRWFAEKKGKHNSIFCYKNRYICKFYALTNQNSQQKYVAYNLHSTRKNSWEFLISDDVYLESVQYSILINEFVTF